MTTDPFTNTEMIKLISQRIRRFRIEYPMTQQELADRCGLSLRSIQHFESGNDIKLSSLFKILTELGLAHNITMLVPDVDDRPSVHLKEKQGKIRQRVRHTQDNNTTVFKWGDET